MRLIACGNTGRGALAPPPLLTDVSWIQCHKHPWFSQTVKTYRNKHNLQHATLKPLQTETLPKHHPKVCRVSTQTDLQRVHSQEGNTTPGSDDIHSNDDNSDSNGNIDTNDNNDNSDDDKYNNDANNDDDDDDHDHTEHDNDS
eukprot:46763-Amphidinium_carterae.1